MVDEQLNPRFSLGDGKDRRQSVMLGWELECPNCPGYLVLTGINVPHKCSGTKSQKIASPTLDSSPTPSPSRGTARQCINLQARTRGQVALKEASLISLLAGVLHFNTLCCLQMGGWKIGRWTLWVSNICIRERSLHPKIFLMLCLKWGTPDVFIMASRFNKKLDQFVTRSRDCLPFSSGCPGDLLDPVQSGVCIPSGEASPSIVKKWN